MAVRMSRAWIFSWLRRWFPWSVRARRRPVVYSAKPMLTALEARCSPTALSGAMMGDPTPPPITQLNRDMAYQSGQTWKRENLAGVASSQEIRLVLASLAQKNDNSVSANTTLPVQGPSLTPTISISKTHRHRSACRPAAVLTVVHSADADQAGQSASVCRRRRWSWGFFDAARQRWRRRFDGRRRRSRSHRR